MKIKNIHHQAISSRIERVIIVSETIDRIFFEDEDTEKPLWKFDKERTIIQSACQNAIRQLVEDLALNAKG